MLASVGVLIVIRTISRKEGDVPMRTTLWKYLSCERCGCSHELHPLGQACHGTSRRDTQCKCPYFVYEVPLHVQIQKTESRIKATQQDIEFSTNTDQKEVYNNLLTNLFSQLSEQRLSPRLHKTASQRQPR